MPKMAGDPGPRRAPPLKTYSRRVNSSLTALTAKKQYLERSLNNNLSGEGDQRRVLGLGDENHGHENNSGLHSRIQQKGNKSTAGTTPTVSQRQALREIDSNQLKKSSSGPLFKQSQETDSVVATTTSSVSQSHTPQNTQPDHVNKGFQDHYLEKVLDKDPQTVISSISSLVNDLRGANDPSSAKIGRNTTVNTLNSSSPTTDGGNTFDSHTLHLVRSSKKRRQPNASDSRSPEAKKVKRSSIKNYFKSLPPSSSPSTCHSTNIFSDNLDIHSSPPTSPLSGGDSPKYKPRKRTRRNLSIKPSLPPVTMENRRDKYDKNLSGLVGSIFEDDRVSDDERIRVRQECVRPGSPFPFASSHSMWQTGGSSPAYDNRVINTNYGSSSPSWVTTSDETDAETARSAPIDIPKKKEQPKHATYTQLRFISERDVNIICDDCGYMFNRTIEHEVREHARWHRHHNRGNHAMKDILGKPLWEGNIDDGFVHQILVSRRGAGLKEREWYEHALETSMRRGLDGPATADIWREIIDPSDQNPGIRVPKYKVYVYTIGPDPVSLILAQRVAKAGAYYCGPQTHDMNGKLEKPDMNMSQEFVNMDRVFPVMVSVDRLWTDEAHRHKGYATKLLDYVRLDWIQGLQLHRCQIAFSLPTSAGRDFATKYCAGAFKHCPFVIDAHDARMVVENGKLKDRWVLSPHLGGKGGRFLKDGGNNGLWNSGDKNNSGV